MMKHLISSVVVAGLWLVSAPLAAAQICAPLGIESQQFWPATGPAILEAQNRLQVGDYGGSLQILMPYARDDLPAFEAAIIHQMMAALYFELQNYAASIAGFEAALESCGLTERQAVLVKVNLAQLYLSEGRKAEGEALITKLLSWPDQLTEKQRRNLDAAAQQISAP